MTNGHPAPGAEGEVVAHRPLLVQAAVHRIHRGHRAEARVPHGKLADAPRRRQVALYQGRRDGQHLRDVVESVVLLIGRQQGVDVDVEAEQVADRVGVLGPVETVDRRPARVGPVQRGPVELGFEPRHERARGFGAGPRAPGRGHRAGTQPPHHVLPGGGMVADARQVEHVQGEIRGTRALVVASDAVPVEEGAARRCGAGRLRPVHRLPGGRRQRGAKAGVRTPARTLSPTATSPQRDITLPLSDMGLTPAACGPRLPLGGRRPGPSALQQFPRRHAVLVGRVEIASVAGEILDHGLESVARGGVQHGVAPAMRLMDDRGRPALDGRLDGLQHAVFVLPLGGYELRRDEAAPPGRAAVRADSHRRHERRSAVIQGQQRVGAGSGEQPQDLRLEVTRGEHQRRCALLAQREDVLIGPTRDGRAPGQSCVRLRSAGQQRAYQRGVRAQHGGVQGAVARAGRIGIGAALQKDLGEPRVAAHRRQDQRAVAVRRRVVHVGAGVQQEAGRVDVPVAGGEQQRREAAGVEVLGARRARRAPQSGAAELARGRRARADVGAVGEEHARDVGMPRGRGPHHRGLASGRLRGVDVRPVIEEGLDRGRVARVRAPHEQRLAGVQSAVGARPGREQPLDDARVPAGAGDPQRGGAEVVLRVHVRAGVDQRFQSRRVVPVRGPVQRGRPVGLRNVDVEPLLQQGRHRVPVLAPGGPDELRIRAASFRTGDPETAEQRDGNQAGARRLTHGKHPS